MRKEENILDYVDLHVHSTASDGTLSPSEVIQLGKEMNLRALALTDHDTVDGIDEALAAGKEYGIEVIPGVELSCSYNNKEIHIVGLFINHKDAFFCEELDRLKETRDMRNVEMAQKFQERGIPITFEDIRTRYPDAIITRAHFASYLHEQGYVSSVKDAFDRYLNDNGPCYVPRYKMPCSETIRLIHDAGGIAILAHPILYRMGSIPLEQMVIYLKKCGLDGIEAIYSTYTPSDESLIRRLARQNNLLISGGSDFHGANKPNIQLGTGKGKLRIPYDVLANIKKTIK